MSRKKKGILHIEPDGYGCNIFLRAPEIDSEQEVSFYDFFPRRPALAMLAAVYNDLLHSWWDISLDNYGIITHDFDDYKALQIVAMPEISEEEKERLEGFIELAEEVADDMDGVAFDPENNIVMAGSERQLLNFLKEFTDSAELVLRPPGIENPAGHFAANLDDGGLGEDYESWQDYAREGLQYAWIMAALPEQSYVNREHLLGDVYRQLFSLTFDFKRIEAMVSKHEAEKAGQKTQQNVIGGRAMIFYCH